MLSPPVVIPAENRAISIKGLFPHDWIAYHSYDPKRL